MGEAFPSLGDRAAALRFDSVGFRYDNGPPVLHEVSFDVPAYFSEFVVEPDGTVEWSRDAVAPRGRRLVTGASELSIEPGAQPGDAASA